MRLDMFITHNNYGHTTIQRIKNHKGRGVIHIHHGSRALEWVNIHGIFNEVLCFLFFSQTESGFVLDNQFNYEFGIKYSPFDQ